MSELTLAGALNRALRAELAQDPKVLVMGEDVGRLGGVFRITEGLVDEFGEDRVRHYKPVKDIPAVQKG